MKGLTVKLIRITADAGRLGAEANLQGGLTSAAIKSVYLFRTSKWTGIAKRLELFILRLRSKWYELAGCL